MKILSWIFGAEAPKEAPKEAPQPDPQWEVQFFSEDNAACSYRVRARGAAAAVEAVRTLSVRGRSPIKDLKAVERRGGRYDTTHVGVKVYRVVPERGILFTRLDGYDSAEEAIDSALSIVPDSRVVEVG